MTLTKRMTLGFITALFALSGLFALSATITPAHAQFSPGSVTGALDDAVPAVLAGGEIPAQYVIEACVRLLPGVLGKMASTEDESFEGDPLEYPQYTRPRVWEGQELPEVLLGGDHGKVANWRREQAEQATQDRRPDLWARYQRRDGET